MKITVLGDGGWGTTVALLLNKNGHEVSLWGPFADNIEKIKTEHENTAFLPGRRIPEDLNLSSNMSDIIPDSEIVVLASPSQFMRGTLEKLKKYYRKEQLLVNLAKGIENESLFTMHKLAESILDGNISYVALSGPTHAEELAEEVPSAIVAASENHKNAEIVQDVFINEYFRVYTSDDLISVELGGAMKNVLAIAAGIIDGMKLGDNPKAAMITRSIAEMGRLGKALGGRAETFAGLSGIGDLIVTCTSGHSRNRHVGEELGKGRSIDEIVDEMNFVVAEGVKTAKSIHELAEDKGVEIPIMNEVYKVIYENKNPAEAIQDLMTRNPKPEKI